MFHCNLEFEFQRYYFCAKVLKYWSENVHKVPKVKIYNCVDRKLDIGNGKYSSIPNTSTLYSTTVLCSRARCKYLHWARAALGRVHPATTGDKLQHLLVGLAGIWHVSQRENLPQQYSKRPAGGDTHQGNSELNRIES